MPRLSVLSEVQRQMLQFFPCMEVDGVPWTPLGKPLDECTAAIVTTAGLHLRDDQPFNRDHPGGESTYRVIPSDSDPADIVQSHFSIGFDRTAIYRDINVTFPHGPDAGVGGAGRYRQRGPQPLLLHGRAARLHCNRRADRPGGGATAQGRGS